PVSRREPQDQGRQDHQPGLRVMSSHRVKYQLAVITLGVAMAAGLSAAGAPTRSQTAPTPATKAASAAKAAPAAADYAGEATCAGRHADKSQKRNPRGRAPTPRPPAATHGCESCHGPGKAHAESGDPALILNPAKVTPQRASDQCTTCHTRASHALWAGSQHDQ